MPEPIPLSESDRDVPMCGWQSPSSDDGYCRCILPVHQGPHMCIHGWLT
jgi:hypothetical protein